MQPEGAALRTAEEPDIEPLAQIWYDGWQETHAPILPSGLARSRTIESFRQRLRAAVPNVRVAGPPGAAVGFCIAEHDELCQIYVAADARGSGIATRLLVDAEQRLASNGVATAWLICATTNARAAAFYRKHGWLVVGTLVKELDGPGGPVALEVWRFEKRLK
jgi:ribosomal protein S18 acetylase RimI-like enzyme